jgi:N-ATPase, AtpR subunit
VTAAVLHILVFLFLGILLGAGYFGLLFASIGQLARAPSTSKVIVPHLLRLAAAMIGFWLIAQYGASALLASLVGFTMVVAALAPLTSS